MNDALSLSFAGDKLVRAEQGLEGWRARVCSCALVLHLSLSDQTRHLLQHVRPNIIGCPVARVTESGEQL